MPSDSNDFRREFNHQCERERELRATTFDMFAMDAGADGRADKIEYWGKRAARLRGSRRNTARLHGSPFPAAPQWGLANKRNMKHARNGVKL